MVCNIFKHCVCVIENKNKDEKIPLTTHYAIEQTIKLRPRNSLDVGNVSTAGKLMRFFVIVTDTILPPSYLMQNAKAFYSGR